MQVSALPQYSEQLAIGHLTPRQYLAVARQAMAALRWRVAVLQGDTIVAHTAPRDPAYGEEVTIHAQGNIITFHSIPVNEHYWIDGKNERNAVMFGNAVAAIVARYEKEERSRNPATREEWGALVPSRTYMVTPILMYLNILVFIAMVLTGISPLEPATQSLLLWGGNFRPSALDGGWWRLGTYMFLHGGVMHLLMNMYALLYIGMYLEPLMGRFRFAAAYLLTGVCAGLMSLAFHSYSVGVGASGAIFGMYGIFLALLTTNHIQKAMRNTLLRSILFFVVFNLMTGLKDGIDNAAHIGGLLSGMAVGYIYYPGISQHRGIKQQAGITTLIVIGVVALAIFTLSTLTNDLELYDRKMARFADTETRALNVYKMNEGAPKAAIMHNIKDSGMHYWNENIKTLTEVQALDLPPRLQERNNLLMQYSRVRLQVYNLLYRQAATGANLTNEINAGNAHIQQLIDELKK